MIRNLAQYPQKWKNRSRTPKIPPFPGEWAKKNKLGLSLSRKTGFFGQKIDQLKKKFRAKKQAWAKDFSGQKLNNFQKKKQKKTFGAKKTSWG